MFGGVGEFSQIGLPYPVREIFEVRVLSGKSRGSDDPFGVDDFEGGRSRFRIVEADLSVVASEGHESVAEDRGFREDPASGFDG